jgi:hypothetical protein
MRTVGLAQAEFCKFSSERLSTELSEALWQEALACKQQLDQITIKAQWPADNQINHIQTHFFDQLLQPIEKQSSDPEKISAVPWSHVFFESCGYEARTEKSGVQANLMLLGLISSGALIGLRASHAPLEV